MLYSQWRCCAVWYLQAAACLKRCSRLLHIRSFHSSHGRANMTFRSSSSSSDGTTEWWQLVPCADIHARPANARRVYRSAGRTCTTPNCEISFPASLPQVSFIFLTRSSSGSSSKSLKGLVTTLSIPASNAEACCSALAFAVTAITGKCPRNVP
jgi:hypothetical protein